MAVAVLASAPKVIPNSSQTEKRACIRTFDNSDFAVAVDLGIDQAICTHGCVECRHTTIFHSLEQRGEVIFVKVERSVQIAAADKAGVLNSKIPIQNPGADRSVACQTHIVARSVGDGLGNKYRYIVLG